MPGRYEHKIDLHIDKSGLKAKVDLSPPCDGLAREVNLDIQNMAARVDSGSRNLLSEIARMSRELQVSALDSYGSNKTGTLAGSITENVSGNSASVGTDLFYAQYVNEGRGSISASEKALHFFNDGEEVFVKSVGPSEPKPYLDDSSAMLSVQIDGIIGAFLESI